MLGAVDVSVTHPLARSIVKSAAKESLAAAGKREREKLRKEKEGAEAIGARCRPFVLETFGAMGQQARVLLREVTHAAIELKTVPDDEVASTKSRWIRLIYQHISVALQKGNCQMLLDGHRTSMHSAPKGPTHVSFQLTSEL